MIAAYMNQKTPKTSGTSGTSGTALFLKGFSGPTCGGGPALKWDPVMGVEAGPALKWDRPPKRDRKNSMKSMRSH